MSSTCVIVWDSGTISFEAVPVFSTFWSFSTIDRPEEDEGDVSTTTSVYSGCTKGEVLSVSEADGRVKY